jgi:organic hydroperoxide reductase OsmC/OhrA
MTDIEAVSTSREGFVTHSVADEWEVTIDAAGEEGPTPNKLLVTNYASCFIPALRVSARENGIDDLGQVRIEVAATLDENDDLSSISFDLHVEATLGEQADAIVEYAQDICHVQSALREGLHADVSVTDGAF